MKIFKQHPLIGLLFLMLAATVLSACTSTTTGVNPLAGAAGEGVTPEATTQATEPVDVAPTATPIPAPTGHIVFVSSRDGQMELYMTTPDGLEIVRLTANASEDITPRLSPDGTRIAFTSTVDNNTDIYVLDIASGNVTRITNAPEKDSAPSWSPDGQWLAFESFRDGNFEIYIASADGANQIRLTNDPSADSTPVWSPVANEIIFVTGRFGNSDLMRVDTNGSLSTLTTNPNPDNSPVWSPDGSFIAFQSFADDLSNLCIVGRDGLNQRCLTSIPEKYAIPSWSPNGSQLAATLQHSTGRSIHLFNVADGSLQELSAPGINPHGTVTWSSDGLRMAFQAETNGDMELVFLLLLTNEFTQITWSPGYDGEPIWMEQ